MKIVKREAIRASTLRMQERSLFIREMLGLGE